MKISVITVNLNNRSGLEATLSSVLSQDYLDFEYLVVDGGSVDGSVEVIRRYADQLAWWVSEPDRGTYHAMNKAAERANGDYLLFLNSGDRLLDTSVLRRMSPHLSGPDIVYGDLRFDSESGATDYVYPDVLTFRYFCRQSLGHPATFIARTLFRKWGPYREEYRICADWVFFIQAICLGSASYRHVRELIAVFDTTGVSSQEAYQVRIAEERKQLLENEFAAFYGDYLDGLRLQSELDRIRSSKAYRLLRKLGVRKFR